MARRSVRTTLLVPAVVLIIATGVSVAALSFYNAKNAVNTVAGELRSEISNRVIERLHSFLAVPPKVLETFAGLLESGHLDPSDRSDLRRQFWDQIGLQDGITSLYFGSPDGGMDGAGREGADGFRYYTHTQDTTAGPWFKDRTNAAGEAVERLVSLPQFDARTRPWYKAATQSNGVAWGDIFVLFTGTDLAIAPSIAVRDLGGKPIGVLASDIFLSHIADFLRDVHKDRPGMTFIIERSGLMVASSLETKPLVPKTEGKGMQRVSAANIGVPLIEGSVDKIVRTLGPLSDISKLEHLSLSLGGNRHFLSVAPFADPYGLSWLVVVVVPENAYLADVKADDQRTILLIGVTLIITVLLGIRLADSIATPIRKIQAASKAVAGGDLNQVLSIARLDELGDLATSFNEMTDKLRSSFQTQAEQLEEITEAEARFRRLIDHAPDALLVIDLETGQIIDANKQATLLFDCSRDELLGHSLLDFEAPNQAGGNASLQHGLETAEEGRNVTMERTIANTKGKMLRCEVRASGLPAHDRRLVCATLIDISVRKKAEEDLQHLNQTLEQRVAARTSELEARIEQDRRTQVDLLQAKERAEQASQAKGEFLANMSHELRTPLNAIVGYSDALLSGVLGNITNPKHAEYVRDIRHSGQYLSALIDDILDLSAIEAGRIELHEAPVRIQDLIATVGRLVHARAVEAGVTIAIQTDKDLPPILADERRLKQIMLNLLSNSIKFTPEGGKVTVSTAADADHVAIVVTDTGIGMTAAEIEHARTRFGQVDSKLSRRYVGTGLGLPLTDSLVNLHGGSLEIESRKGKWTKVVVRLPKERLATPATQQI